MRYVIYMLLPYVVKCFGSARYCSKKDGSTTRKTTNRYRKTEQCRLRSIKSCPANKRAQQEIGLFNLMWPGWDDKPCVGGKHGVSNCALQVQLETRKWNALA